MHTQMCLYYKVVSQENDTIEIFKKQVHYNGYLSNYKYHPAAHIFLQKTQHIVLTIHCMRAIMWSLCNEDDSRTL